MTMMRMSSLSEELITMRPSYSWWYNSRLAMMDWSLLSSRVPLEVMTWHGTGVDPSTWPMSP